MKGNHMKAIKDARNRSDTQRGNYAGSYKVKPEKMFNKARRHKPKQMKTRLKGLCSK